MKGGGTKWTRNREFWEMTFIKKLYSIRELVKESKLRCSLSATLQTNPSRKKSWRVVDLSVQVRLNKVIMHGRVSSTLGARGFSCAVSGVGHVSIVTRANFSRLRRSCPYPNNARKKPLVPRVSFKLLLFEVGCSHNMSVTLQAFQTQRRLRINESAFHGTLHVLLHKSEFLMSFYSHFMPSAQITVFHNFPSCACVI